MTHLRNISDTALWVAVYRARESERSDALFKDPFARRLAGERGEEVARRIRDRSWAFVVRTYLFDQFIQEGIAQGVDGVLNLAAGLDTRPYRMELPPSVRWYEVDLPELMDYKEDVLKHETPRCNLERVSMDLRDVAKRRSLFERIGVFSQNIMVLTEGLIIYLDATEVSALAKDLAAPRTFQHWVLDIASPGLLRMMQSELGEHLDAASAPLKFAPEEGPDFFTQHGWKPVAVESNIKAATRLKRGPLLVRLFGLLPDSKRPPGNRPWGGVCLFKRSSL